MRIGRRRRKVVEEENAVACLRCSTVVSEEIWWPHLRDRHGWSREEYLRFLGGISSIRVGEDLAPPPRRLNPLLALLDELRKAK